MSIPVGEITGHFAKTPEQPWAWRVQRETLGGPASFWCGCSCGWLETGWPNFEIAKASMTKHLEKAHRDPALIPQVTPETARTEPHAADTADHESPAPDGDSRC